MWYIVFAVYAFTRSRASWGGAGKEAGCMKSMRVVLKRALLLFLSAACALLFLFLPGASSFAEEDAPVLTIGLMRVDTQPFDSAPLIEALNDHLLPRIGMRVELCYINSDEYDAALNDFLLTDSLPDVFYLPDISYAKTLCEGGHLMPLDALLEEHGSGILALMEGEMLDACRLDGGCYLLPSLYSYANAFGFEYRVDIAERNGIDMSAVRSIEDLTEVFRTLKANEPELICVGQLSAYRSWDPLGDSLGVLMDCGQSDTVVNLYQTEEYRQLCLLWHEWNREGYVLDTRSYSAPINYFVRSENVFGKFVRVSPALVPMDSADADTAVGAIAFTDSFLCRQDHQRVLWAMSADCDEPEGAMQFLELLYTDPVVSNLLCYGVEGVHYQMLDAANGVIGYPEGASRATSPYSIFRNYALGNEFNTYVWEGWPVDLWRQVQENNERSARSHAYATPLDTSAVAAEVEQCSAIAERYTELLLAGVGDVDEVLDAFNQELHAAGIDRIIAEKQRQIDAAR